MRAGTLRIKSFRKKNDDGPVRVSMQLGAREHHLFFESKDIQLAYNMDVFLTLGFVPAMKHADTLIVDGEVSPRLLESIYTLSGIYRSWYPSLHDITIEKAVPAVKTDIREQRVGLFFSGGVDSFYTLLRHCDEITDLIFVQGFDVDIDNDDLREKTMTMVRDIGSHFGKRVIEVRTNLRLSFLEQYVGWGILGHGPALTCVGHLLYPYFKRIYIAASDAYKDTLVFPWGSHPLLDPLWSSETLEFVHDGCEADRVQKVALISECDKAMKSLRVCYQNRDGAYNCGRCVKCLITMINLYTVGALDRCTTFDAGLDVREVSRLLILRNKSGDGYVNLKTSLDELERKKDYGDVYKALKPVLNRPRWRTKMIRETRRLGCQLNNIFNRMKSGENQDKVAGMADFSRHD